MRLQGYTIGDFDRGASRFKEALWLLTKWFFFMNSFPWPSSLRRGLLRMFGAGVGSRVVIRANVNITYPWRIFLGDDVWLGEEVHILSLASVTVESSVCISQRAFLCTGSHDFRSEAFSLIAKPIIVRSGSWIAAQAFIAPGVTVGAGSMVCAGSVVTADVPAQSFVRGNPAQAAVSLP